MMTRSRSIAHIPTRECTQHSEIIYNILDLHLCQQTTNSSTMQGELTQWHIIGHVCRTKVEECSKQQTMQQPNLTTAGMRSSQHYTTIYWDSNQTRVERPINLQSTTMCQTLTLERSGRLR